ncbi:MAG: MCP four helix bundle domain-containing protein [Nitrospirota bacterium]
MIEQRQWVRSWWPLLPLARHRVAVSLLVIGLGLFSAQALKQVDRDLRGLYTEYTLAATDLAHIMTDVIRYRATIINALEAPTQKEFERITASLPDQRANILGAVERFSVVRKQVSGRGPSHGQKIQAVQDSLHAYFTAADQTMSLLLSVWTAKSTHEAAEFRRRAEQYAAGNAGDKLVQAIQALDRLQETVAEVGKELKDEGTRVVRDVSTALLLGSMLIGVLNLYIFRRSPIGNQ